MDFEPDVCKSSRDPFITGSPTFRTLINWIPLKTLRRSKFTQKEDSLGRHTTLLLYVSRLHITMIIKEFADFRGKHRCPYGELFLFIWFIGWCAVSKGNMLEKLLTRNCQSQMPQFNHQFQMSKSKCQMKFQLWIVLLFELCHLSL